MTKRTTMTVSTAMSAYGTPQPQIEVRFPKATPYRVWKAALHTLAAQVEGATPSPEGWVVELDADRRRVYLELVYGTAAETERGLKILRTVTA